MLISQKYLRPERYYLAASFIVDDSIRRLDGKPGYTYVVYRVKAPPMTIYRIRQLLNTFHFPYHYKSGRFRVLKRELDTWLASEMYATYVKWREKL